ncbi:MAG TPA: aspartate kinase [Bryobacteraceae bacterium]|nr:aspartate kinase [Bryobacteraceae bacterium]
MIVMKFGGTSVESGDAIARLVGTVNSHLAQRPVVVVSALGKTTNKLLEFAEHARRGELYLGSKCLSELQDHHFEVSGQVANGEALHCLETFLQRSFRDLRVILSEVAQEGREVTPALLDEIASFGERMSSQIVAAALESGGLPSVHLDARQMILTDARHTHATPLYWESYANLRRVIPFLCDGRVVVMGGFIGSTKDGVTTTLGRGGSDLTASIVGAGILADEIQIWTDVDGMLTCDPAVFQGVYRLRSLSYQEAAALAGSGAKVLHPDTVTPAVRQRIPLVIRNSRKPAVEGTRIIPAVRPCSNPVKAIACKPDLTVLEIRTKDERDPAELTAALAEMCARHGMPAEFLCQNERTIFLALKSSTRYRDLPIELAGCLEVRLHTRSAILTLVGEGIDGTPEIVARSLAALKQIPALLLSSVRSKLAVSLLVHSSEMQRSVEMLHCEFFQQIDPLVFAECQHQGVEGPQYLSTATKPVDNAVRTARRFRPLTVVCQN